MIASIDGHGSFHQHVSARRIESAKTIDFDVIAILEQYSGVLGSPGFNSGDF